MKPENRWSVSTYTYKTAANVVDPRDRSPYPLNAAFERSTRDRIRAGLLTGR
jgi:hypothetical protein